VLFANNWKTRAALAVLAPLLLTILLEAGPHAHYLAPGCSLLFLISMCGMRFLSLKARRFGPALLLLFVVIVFGNGLLEFFPARFPNSSPRRAVLNRLKNGGGKHLVLVRYNPAQTSHFDYIYNSADIDHSPVVWAYDLGEEKNRELLNYYSDRKVWLLQPQLQSMRLTPYAAGENGASWEHAEGGVGRSALDNASQIQPLEGKGLAANAGAVTR
jgi:hypothetical protein